MEAEIPTRTGRGTDQFVLRLPPGLRDTLKRQAADNQRSLNAEIVFHLLATAQQATAKEPRQ